MNGGIFLSAKELMILTGSQNYSSCANTHRAIRDAIADGKRKLTIKEYCDFYKIDFEYVWCYLRKQSPVV